MKQSAPTTRTTQPNS